MDRLLMQRGLVALSGLALMMASSGCRDRNVRVPPPAHYSDGGATPVPEGSYSAPSLDPTAIDPYSASPYGASAGSYDPAASPTSGSYDPAAGAYDPYAAPAGMDAYANPAASTAPTGYGVPGSQGVYASPSSPSAYQSTPYDGVPSYDPMGAGLVTGADAVSDFGSSYPSGQPDLPAIDGGLSTPPVPGDLPLMP